MKTGSSERRARSPMPKSNGMPQAARSVRASLLSHPCTMHTKAYSQCQPRISAFALAPRHYTSPRTTSANLTLLEAH